jgi:hypothetical protein
MRCTWENEAYSYKGNSLGPAALAAEPERWIYHSQLDSLRQVVSIRNYNPAQVRISAIIRIADGSSVFEGFGRVFANKLLPQ